jgi:CubicO group peptidase (beta-lactamase class C family)
MSAAVAEGDRIIWSRGFGTADRERAVSAGPDTIYGLASLTKPYASTVVLQLVREGRLGLDDEVSRLAIAMERSAPVTIRHLLSHTSGEPPGTRYRYDGNAFGALTQIIERATGRSFATELADRIIRPLDLTRTGPNPGDPGPSGRSSHRWYALGWFVQDVDGREVVWHYGQGLESSSLIVKVPSERVTFVSLANSDGLSRRRRLGDSADVMASPAAMLFMNWLRSRR